MVNLFRRNDGTPRPSGRTSLTTASNSLCYKFLARTIPAVLVAGILFMVAFGVYSQKNIRDEIDADVEVFARTMSRVLDELMWNFQTEEIVSTLSTISGYQSLVGARLLDENGDVFLTYGVTPADSEPHLKSNTQEIIRRKPDGTKVHIGELTLYYTYQWADTEFRILFLEQLSGLVILLLVFTGVAILAFQRTIGHPLSRLLRSIRSLEHQGTWQQIPLTDKDEIGEVIAAHNSMIRQILRNKEALADSEKRYRQLFDNALVGLFVMRPDGTMKEGNKTTSDILGYASVKELFKHNILEHYENPQDRESLWRTLREGKEVSRFLAQIKNVQGKQLRVEISGRLNTDGNFNGVVQDVTKQYEAERAMNERDELHRAFFEENKAVMLLHDPSDSSIQFVNPAACQYYGYTNEELTSMTIRDLDCMTDAELYEELRNAAEEKRGYFKHIHTLKDGSKRDVEVFTGPVSLGNRQLHYSIIHDVTEKRRLEAKLERMATRDQLTGAYNRHAFFRMGKDEVVRTQRFGHSMAVLAFDLDNFKQVNDTHGHATGDEVLRTFALRCRADLRQSDLFARLGGEEFAAILVETDKKHAVEVAKRIRTKAAEQAMPTDVGELTVTVSVGVATLRADETLTMILKRADKRLYMAKEGGRNTVISE